MGEGTGGCESFERDRRFVVGRNTRKPVIRFRPYVNNRQPYTRRRPGRELISRLICRRRLKEIWTWIITYTYKAVAEEFPTVAVPPIESSALGVVCVYARAPAMFSSDIVVVVIVVVRWSTLYYINLHTHARTNDTHTSHPYSRRWRSEVIIFDVVIIITLIGITRMFGFFVPPDYLFERSETTEMNFSSATVPLQISVSN